MGRYDLRPLRVHQTVTQLLAAEKLKVPPAWYDTVGSIAPSQALVRTQPFQHHERSNQPRAKARKPSRSFQPTQIVYPEDQLRKEFFSDHPWELARPRMVLEVDGKDAERCDWSKMSQTGRALSGESVIQRQLWLLRNVPHMTRAQAYDQARKEFYALRLKEDVQRRVAQEEAMSTGAYFGKSTIEVGMEIEDKVYETWKKWAEKQIELREQRKASGPLGEMPDTDKLDELNPELELEPEDELGIELEESAKQEQQDLIHRALGVREAPR